MDHPATLAGYRCPSVRGRAATAARIGRWRAGSRRRSVAGEGLSSCLGGDSKRIAFLFVVSSLSNSLMPLHRLHAYSVSPGRTANAPIAPDGGAVSVTAELRRVIEGNINAAKFDRRTAVDFQVDPTSRTNQTRDSVIEFGFGEGAAGRAAALSLARRLAQAMDRRSAPCLFVAAAFRDGEGRAVYLWTFPRDEAFRFRRGPSGPAIEVLTDVFSQTSRLRKAARFQGRDLRTEFLSGRVLDFQTNSASRVVADFWIGRFLDSRFAIGGDAGTRLLARVVRKAYGECTQLDDKEALYAAVMAMRRSPQRRVSLMDFADRYLGGPAREAFLSAVPNQESLESVFEFSRDVFDSTVQFRTFQLDTGVFVSSPLTQIGESVQITEGERRQLSCRGGILDEQLRTRRG
jgi:hypothetical protein